MPKTELVIDKESDDSENSYFLQSDRVNQLQYVSTNSFTKATIKNCPAKYLNPFNLQCLFHSLQLGGSATIFVDQPVLVMQEYDADAIIANAELAGFKNIETDEANIFCPGLQHNVDVIKIILTK